MRSKIKQEWKRQRNEIAKAKRRVKRRNKVNKTLRKSSKIRSLGLIGNVYYCG